MNLSESYKRRLMELAGNPGLLQEKDNRPTIKSSLKLPDYVADWAHNLSDKYSIWIADSFKNLVYQLAFPPDLRDDMVKSFEEGKSPEAFRKVMDKYMRQLTGDYRYALDWLQGRTNPPVQETDRIDFKTLTLDDAKRRSQDWHTALEAIQGGRIEDEDGEVVMTFPDGFYWINLGKNYCAKEGQAMGHCGRGEGNLFSLRKKGEPYITADVLTNGTVRQLRGRANTKPKAEYHPYIIKFLLSEYVRGFNYWDYKIDQNFMLEDLETNTAYELIKKKMSLLQGQKISNTNFSTEQINGLIKTNPIITIDALSGRNDAVKNDILSKITPEIIWIILRDRENEIDFNLSRLTNLTPEQKKYIIDKEVSGDWDFLQDDKIADLNFSSEQIRYLIRNKPEIFNPSVQDFESLGITEEEIEFLFEETPGNFNEIKFVNALGAEKGKAYYEKHKDKFNSLYNVLNFKDIDRLKKLKVGGGDSFSDEGVLLRAGEWSDDWLVGLFGKDEGKAKTIVNYELDLYGYDYSFKDLSYNVDDINTANYNEIANYINKAITTEEDKERLKESLDGKDKIENNSDLFDVLKDYSEFEASNELGDVRNAIIRASEDSQRDADEGEYWKLFTKPLEELLGKSKWVDKKVKVKDKEGKEKMETRNFLEFTMPYSQFFEIIDGLETHAADYSYDKADRGYEIGVDETISPTDLLTQYINDVTEEHLRIDEPQYGVNGDVKPEHFNEHLSERLSEFI